MTPQAVLAFGVLLSTAATWMLAHFVNVLTAALALAGFYFYVFIYTRWLKRTSPQNIVIGGAAGAFPPLVGWAAVTNTIGWPAVGLFAIIFLWTPPHFWALALMTETDYGKAGIPMLPNVFGDQRTKRDILLYAIVLLAASVALYWPLHVMGPVYGAGAAVLGGIFTYYAVRTMRDGTTRSARTTFLYSLLYLAFMCASMVIDRILF
jgi:protoheme IX farnesyltransferase